MSMDNEKYCENCGGLLHDNNIGDLFYELCHYCIIAFREKRGEGDE